MPPSRKRTPIRCPISRLWLPACAPSLKFTGATSSTGISAAIGRQRPPDGRKPISSRALALLPLHWRCQVR